MATCMKNLVNIDVFLGSYIFYYLLFWGPEDHFWTSFWQLSGGLGEQIRVWGGFGDRLKFRWILVPPLGDPKLREPGPGKVKGLSPGHTPASYRLEGGVRIQHTGYYMLHS